MFVPFNSHEWPRQNFSLQYQYNIKQTSDEIKEKYQLGDYKLIQNQILQTNIIRTVWQTVRRITNEILGVKGLRCYTTVEVLYQSDWWKLIDKESKQVQEVQECLSVVFLNVTEVSCLARALWEKEQIKHL